jgi:hypothetical protein
MNPIRQQMDQLLRDRFKELQAREPVEVDQSPVTLTPQQSVDLLTELHREVDEALGPEQ